jgi:hypothetical protein
LFFFDNSISSGVAFLAPAPLSLPAAALTQLRSVMLNQSKFLGGHSNGLAAFHPLDRQLLELGGVFLPRYLHRLPFQSNFCFTSPLEDYFSGKLIN